MRTTADHVGDRPEDSEAPGAMLIRSAATDRIPALADLGRVHIIDIVGSGMNALARILFDRGVPVSGCEARESITVAGAASARRRRRHWPLPAAPRRHRRVRLHGRHQPPARGARRRAGERQAGPAPGRRAGRPLVRRGSRHPRQTSTTSLLVVALQAYGLDPSFANGVLVERPDQSAGGDTHAA
jgi:UDP-N-acetylmuramate--alanine ligase